MDGSEHNSVNYHRTVHLQMANMVNRMYSTGKKWWTVLLHWWFIFFFEILENIDSKILFLCFPILES